MSELFKYCNTDRQKEIIRLYESGLNKTEVGRQLGITRETVKGAIKIIQDRAAKQGYSPNHYGPPGARWLPGVRCLDLLQRGRTPHWPVGEEQADADRRIEMMIERIEQGVTTSSHSSQHQHQKRRRLSALF